MTESTTRKWGARTVAAALAGALLAGGALAQDAFVGLWQGTIGPGELDLGILVEFTLDGGELTGTIDIPAQGADDLPLEVRAVGADTVTFAIVGIPGDPTFEGALVEGRLEGDFSQAGQRFAFALGREDLGLAASARPQDPVPPFPYREEEVAYRSGAVDLAGTLTLPEGDGPFPAVVMITGSGAQDRDETLVGHRPFAVIADALTRAGFAVLRSDDRGVGGSSGVLAEATYQDLVGDVLAGVELLRGRSDIDPARVGLLGHSEGGYLAPLAATGSDGVAFVILLAGPSKSGLEVLKLQNELIFRLDGADQAEIDEQLAFLDRLAPALEQGDFEAARALVRERVESSLASLPAEERPSPEGVEQIVEAQIEGVATPNFASFLGYDPQPALRELTVPTLALYGNLDIQVPAVQNVGPMRGALRVAANDDATVTVFEGLNHLFQPATTGAIQEYAQIETTIDPAVLDEVVTWLTERFGT